MISKWDAGTAFLYPFFVEVIMSLINISNLTFGYVLEYKPTLLFVEHDIAFCEHIATKTVELSAS